MRKIGLALLLNRPDSPLSPHFGMAKWIGIHETEAGRTEFVANVDLNGRATVDLLRQYGCTDVICQHIGEGALHLLQSSGIRVWLGTAGVPLNKLVEELLAGKLAPATTSSHHGQHGHHRHQHGQKHAHKAGYTCCCQQQA
jgi:predicted Fe-Mo cluster-binding NifX family protein